METEIPISRQPLRVCLDLGEHLALPAPGGGQPLEAWSVFEADLGEALVESLDVDPLRPRWWPRRKLLRLCERALPQGALCVADPLPMRRIDARIERQRTATVFLGRAHPELNLDGAVIRQGDRGLLYELLELRGAELHANSQRELHAGCAGDDHRSEDCVVR